MIHKRRYRTNRIKEYIIEHIRNNFIEYIVVILILIIGIIFGTIYINNIDISQKEELSTYISGFLEDTYSGSEIDLNKLLKTSIFNNVIIIILLWIFGLTAIGMPIIYGIVAIKGFCLGYTISTIIGSLGVGSGIKFVIATMLLQNVIMIPCILILAVSGIRLYKDIVKDKRRENIKIEIFKYTIITIVIGIFSLLSALIETYISSNIFRVFFL